MIDDEFASQDEDRWPRGRSAVSDATLYAVHPKSVEPVLTVPESGFDVRLEVRARLGSIRPAYRAGVVVKNRSRSVEGIAVRPFCFSGLVYDWIYWSAPVNEFIFRISPGGFRTGERLEVFGLVELSGCERRSAFVVHAAPLSVV